MVGVLLVGGLALPLGLAVGAALVSGGRSAAPAYVAGLALVVLGLIGALALGWFDLSPDAGDESDFSSLVVVTVLIGNLFAGSLGVFLGSLWGGRGRDGAVPT